MDPIGRKRLPHDGAPFQASSSEGETYFITINCLPRHVNQLAREEIWRALEETLRFRETNGDLRCGLALAMPDHLHGLFGFPGAKSMDQVITAVKSWMAGKHAICWQRDFFDHRIRSWENAAEKAHYIRMNPVRAGLVERTEDWPYQR